MTTTTTTSASRGEMLAAGRIITRALRAGYAVSVYDGEEWALKRSTSRRKILAALASTDSDTLTLRNAVTGERVGCIWFVYGNSPEELAADYTDKPEIAALVEETEQ